MVEPDELAEHARFLRGLARDLVHDPDAAEDVAQEVLVSGLERPPRERRGLVAWLTTAARRAAATFGRREQTRLRHEPRAGSGESLVSTVDVVAREEITRRVVDAVFALDEPYKTALLLRYYEDLKPREIAARLGVPVETVRTRLKRGLEKVRARLDQGASGDRRAWAGLLIESLALESAATSGGAIVVLAAAAILLLASGGWWIAGSRTDATRMPEAVNVQAIAAATALPAPTPVSRELTATPTIGTNAEVSATAPDPRTTIHGRVVDGRGQPIARVRVWVLCEGDWPRADSPPSIVRRIVVAGASSAPPPAAVTTSDGWFQILEMRPFVQYFLLVEADGFNVSTGWTRPAEPASFTIEAARPLEGVVVDAVTGRLLAGVGVTLAIDGINGGNAMRWARVETDRDGAFRFTKSTAGSARRLTLDRPGCVPCVVATELRDDGGALDAIARWPATERIRGRIFDAATGSPIAGARVSAFDDVWYAYQEREPDSEAIREIATSDAAGSIVFEAADAGLQLVIEVEGHVGVLRTLGEVEADAAGVRQFPLGVGATVDGVVLDGDGRPADGVRVLASTTMDRIDGWGEAREAPPWMTGVLCYVVPRHSYRVFTDTAGRFHLSGVFDGEAWRGGSRALVVTVRADDSTRGTADSGPIELPFEDGHADLVLRLRSPMSEHVIEGRVLLDGEPLAAAVRCDAGGETTACTTNELGEYRLAIDSRLDEVLLMTVPDGIQLFSERSGPTLEHVEVDSGSPTQHDVVVAARRGTITGTVRLADGVPVAGAEIESTQHLPDQGYSHFRATTDANGRFSLALHDLLGNRFDVGVRHGAFSEDRQGVLIGASDVDFVVPSLGVVRLLVRDQATHAPLYWPSIRVRMPGASKFEDVNVGRKALPDVDGGVELSLPLGTVAIRIGDVAGRSRKVTLDPVLVTGTVNEPIVVDVPSATRVDFALEAADGRELAPHLFFLLAERERGGVRGGLNAQRGWDIDIDGRGEGTAAETLARSFHFEGTRPTFGVDAAPGHYFLFALPDDLVFDPAELDVGEPAAAPADGPHAVPTVVKVRQRAE